MRANLVSVQSRESRVRRGMELIDTREETNVSGKFAGGSGPFERIGNFVELVDESMLRPWEALSSCISLAGRALLANSAGFAASRLPRTAIHQVRPIVLECEPGCRRRRPREPEPGPGRQDGYNQRHQIRNQRPVRSRGMMAVDTICLDATHSARPFEDRNLATGGRQAERFPRSTSAARGQV